MQKGNNKESVIYNKMNVIELVPKENRLQWYVRVLESVLYKND